VPVVRPRYFPCRSALVTLVAVSVALPGCFGGKNPDARCNDVEQYRSASTVPLVVAPDGLTAPARGSGYAVPEPGSSGDVDGAACLARPPDYFRSDPPAPPAQEAAQ
jgi:uncharacterized lipoprotein